MTGLVFLSSTSGSLRRTKLLHFPHLPLLARRRLFLSPSRERTCEPAAPAQVTPTVTYAIARRQQAAADRAARSTAAPCRGLARCRSCIHRRASSAPPPRRPCHGALAFPPCPAAGPHRAASGKAVATHRCALAPLRSPTDPPPLPSPIRPGIGRRTASPARCSIQGQDEGLRGED